MKTLVDIPDDLIAELAHIGKLKKTTRAELVRQAIYSYVKLNKPAEADAFGLWGCKEDGLQYQEKMRSEW